MSMEKTIAIIPGDGIGPSVVEEAVKVLDAVAVKFGHKFNYVNVTAGGCAIDAFNNPLPQAELDKCLSSDAVLLGAVGGPKWDNVEPSLRPEKALLGLRKGLSVYANLRPAVLWNQLKNASPLKDEITSGGIDILIVRELTGGIYFGEHGIATDGQSAWDTEKYSVYEIERILKTAFEAALKRNKRVCLVDKANILTSSQLWRKIASEYAGKYPQVEYSTLYVDNAAMQLVRNPKQFDVIVTSNMFGDILSDEASQITGSIGMLASASLGDTERGLYEPIHGSAPDIAGLDKANPLAEILSAAMLLRYSFNMEEEAVCIENAVNSVLDEGYRTEDIAGSAEERELLKQKNLLTGTKEMGRLVREKIV